VICMKMKHKDGSKPPYYLLAGRVLPDSGTNYFVFGSNSRYAAGK